MFSNSILHPFQGSDSLYFTIQGDKIYSKCGLYNVHCTVYRIWTWKETQSETIDPRTLICSHFAEFATGKFYIFVSLTTRTMKLISRFCFYFLHIPVCCSGVTIVAKCIVPDWGEKVDYGIGFSYRPASLRSLAGRRQPPMHDIVDFFRPVRDYELVLRNFKNKKHTDTISDQSWLIVLTL